MSRPSTLLMLTPEVDINRLLMRKMACSGDFKQLWFKFTMSRKMKNSRNFKLRIWIISVGPCVPVDLHLFYAVISLFKGNFKLTDYSCKSRRVLFQREQVQSFTISFLSVTYMHFGYLKIHLLKQDGNTRTKYYQCAVYVSWIWFLRDHGI